MEFIVAVKAAFKNVPLNLVRFRFFRSEKSNAANFLNAVAVNNYNTSVFFHEATLCSSSPPSLLWRISRTICESLLSTQCDNRFNP